jgi:hypothetical protein
VPGRRKIRLARDIRPPATLVRAGVIALILSRPADKMFSFAEAFRIREDD